MGVGRENVVEVCGTRVVDAATDMLEKLIVEARVEFGQIDAAALERWECRARACSALRDHLQNRSTWQAEFLIKGGKKAIKYG